MKWNVFVSIHLAFRCYLQQHKADGKHLIDKRNCTDFPFSYSFFFVLSQTFPMRNAQVSSCETEKCGQRCNFHRHRQMLTERYASAARNSKLNILLWLGRYNNTKWNFPSIRVRVRLSFFHRQNGNFPFSFSHNFQLQQTALNWHRHILMLKSKWFNLLSFSVGRLRWWPRRLPTYLISFCVCLCVGEFLFWKRTNEKLHFTVWPKRRRARGSEMKGRQHLTYFPKVFFSRLCVFCCFCCCHCCRRQRTYGHTIPQHYILS